MPDHEHIQKLVDRALRFPVAERRAFLVGACGDDEALRREVERRVSEVSTSAPTIPQTPETGDASTTIGPYRLIEKLGEGGFGSVWAAEQREPVRRRVALKIIKLGMDTRQVVARFEGERQALALMDHPHIARVLDAGATGTGRPYFVMDLVKGLPITAFCEQEKLDVHARLHLFIKVCQAIQHAHQKGIIHRDIKPSNILVALQDGAPVPKVIDFGIAKAMRQDLTEKTVHTQIQQFLGTPAYASPEQAGMSLLDIDTRSDIYSLGVLLYELLTGTTPFDSRELLKAGPDEMRKIIRERDPLRPSTRLSQCLSDGGDPGGDTDQGKSGRAVLKTLRSRETVALLRGDLDSIVMKCLEKDHTRRYETANALVADLRHYLNNEPVQARPASAAYRLQKAFRRHRLGFAAGTAVILALVLGFGGVTLALLRESEANRRLSIAEQDQIRLREDADEQRDLARVRLYETLLREARSLRQARQPGYREAVFDRLRQAIDLRTPNFNASDVLREASACLGDWVGLNPLDIPGPISPVADALLPDGTLAAVGGRDGTVAVIDVTNGTTLSYLSLSGRPDSLVLTGSGRFLHALVTRPDASVADRLASASLEKWRRQGRDVWTRESQQSVPGAFSLQMSDAGPLSVSYDSETRTLLVAELGSGQRIAALKLDLPPVGYPRVAVSDDRQFLACFSRLASGDFDVDVELWDLAAGHRLGRLEPKLGPGVGLSFAPGGRALVCTFDNNVMVYDTERKIWENNLGGSFAETSGAAIGGNGPLLAVPSYQEQTLYLIQVTTGAEVAALTLPDQPLGVRFSQDGRILLVRHEAGSRIVRLEANHEKRELKGHLGGVPAMEFSPDGTRLVSVGKDRTLRNWDVQGGGGFRMLGQLTAPGQSLALRDGDGLTACGFYDSDQISLWLPGREDAAAGNLNEASGSADITWSCAISSDGTLLAAAGDGLRVWQLPAVGFDAGEGKPLGRLVFSETRGDANVVFDPKGRRVAYLDILEGYDTFTTGLFIRGLEAQSTPVLITTNSHNSVIQVLDFLPRSGRIICTTRDRRVMVVDPDSLETISSFPTLEPGETPSTYICNLRVSPDERLLATVSATGLGVNLWDPTDGRRLFSLPDEPGSIWWLAWSPDGRRLAVSRANGNISVWNLDEVQSQLAALEIEP